MSNATVFPKKVVRSLFATTSLTAITAVGAHAGTITELSDFGNSFGTATALPVGTDRVLASLTPVSEGGDGSDWFEFSSLQAGGSFSLAAKFNPLGEEAGFRINLYDSSGSLVPYSSVSGVGFGGPTLEGSGTVITGFIPNDGNLFADVFAQFARGRGAGYQVDLTASVQGAPEPVTSVGVGLGLAVAGGVAWRRRRKAVPEV